MVFIDAMLLLVQCPVMTVGRLMLLLPELLGAPGYQMGLVGLGGVEVGVRMLEEECGGLVEESEETPGG